MKFGYKEIKEFAENHEDERVRIMYRRLCEARSKSAKWCEEVERLNQMLRETGYGQGQIDAYASLCEEVEELEERVNNLEFERQTLLIEKKELFNIIKEWWQVDGFLPDELTSKIEKILDENSEKSKE